MRLLPGSFNFRRQERGRRLIREEVERGLNRQESFISNHTFQSIINLSLQTSFTMQPTKTERPMGQWVVNRRSIQRPCNTVDALEQMKHPGSIQN